MKAIIDGKLYDTETADDLKVNQNRKYLALSIEHSSGKIIDGNVFFWGSRTKDDEKRSFSGYSAFFENAELYTLEEFAKKYPHKWMNTKAGNKFSNQYKNKFKEFDTVLFEYSEIYSAAKKECEKYLETKEKEIKKIASEISEKFHYNKHKIEEVPKYIFEDELNDFFRNTHIDLYGAVEEG